MINPALTRRGPQVQVLYCPPNTLKGYSQSCNPSFFSKQIPAQLQPPGQQYKFVADTQVISQKNCRNPFYPAYMAGIKAAYLPLICPPAGHADRLNN